MSEPIDVLLGVGTAWFCAGLVIDNLVYMLVGFVFFVAFIAESAMLHLGDA